MDDKRVTYHGTMKDTTIINLPKEWTDKVDMDTFIKRLKIKYFKRRKLPKSLFIKNKIEICSNQFKRNKKK